MSKKKENICILGLGGHAVSCIDLIESTKKYKIVGLISKKNENLSNKNFFNNYKIIGSDDDFKKIFKFCKNITIGFSSYKNLDLRYKIFNKLKTVGFKLPIICSQNSYVSKNVEIGEGSQIFHGVTINKNSTVGKNCIVNSHSLIEHDVRLQNNTHISTGVTVNGNCDIGKNTFIGSGSILRENLLIKEKSFIKMGTILKK